MLRRQMLETTATPRRERAPIVETLHDHWRTVLGFAGLSVFNAVGFYVSFVYLVSWLQNADHIAAARALEINSFSMAILLVVVVASGLLTDRFGRKPLLLLATILGFIGAMPLFWLLDHPSVWLAQLGQLGLVLIVGLYQGAQPAILVEAAPLKVRCTAVSLGYNIAFGVIGGLTPLVASWLVARTGDEIAPGFLMMVPARLARITALTANSANPSTKDSNAALIGDLPHQQFVAAPIPLLAQPRMTRVPDGVLILTSPLFCEWRSHSTMSAFGGKADIVST